MGVFAINYDLSSPDRDYDKLTEQIKSYGTWAHFLDSLWLVSSSKTAGEIRDHLKKHIDSNDQLFVARLSGNWASSNLSKKCTDWLKNRTF